MTIFYKDLIRLMVTFIYATGYHMMYVDFLNPQFEYAHYRLGSRSWLEWGFTYLIILMPVIWQRGRNNAVATGVSLIYLLLYVPGLITICAMWIFPFGSYVLLALALLIGQFIIQLSIPSRKSFEAFLPQSNKMPFDAKTCRTILILTSISIAIFIFENRAHMSLVGFDDVYDLRFASRDSRSVVSGYLTMWLLGVSIPYILAIAVKNKSWVLALVAITLSVSIYMGNGAKSALLMPIEGVLVGLLVWRKRDSTYILATFLAVFIWLLYIIDSELLNLLKSLFLMRTLSTGGWTITTYYEFFSLKGLTYFSHVGPIGALIGKSYSIEPGQLIGLEYSLSEDANFNANFWATDGIASLGVIGVIIASILLALVLRAFFNITRGMDQRAVSILLAGLWLSLLNASLFTSMLSGGGFLIYILLFFSRRRLMNK